jgi:hypothetical protein
MVSPRRQDRYELVERKQPPKVFKSASAHVLRLLNGCYAACSDPMQQGLCREDDQGKTVRDDPSFVSAVWAQTFYNKYSDRRYCSGDDGGLSGVSGRVGASHRAASSEFRAILFLGLVGSISEEDVAWIKQNAGGCVPRPGELVLLMRRKDVEQDIQWQLGSDARPRRGVSRNTRSMGTKCYNSQ